MVVYLLFLLLMCACGPSAATINNRTIDDPDDYAELANNNSLWMSLLKNCKKPSLECVEKSMFDYLRDTLEYPKDYRFASFLKLTKNSISYQNISKKFDDSENDNSTTPDDVDEFYEETSPIEEMSRSLHNKGVKFLMTHDLEFKLPEMFFEGSTLKISPRSFEENGALVKVEFIPKQIAEGAVEGRILFKKLKKQIGEKLLFALLAILLVIKLLAVKFLFFMPMMVGAVTAKKLLIKVLLFLFPALHHLFKLCPYVPHGAKFHHHKHQISHIHHVAHKPHHHHLHHDHHDGVEVIAPHDEGPPVLAGHSLHHFVDHEPPHKPFYRPHEQELEYVAGGPAFTNHFITHRQDPDQVENEIPSWGQGHLKKPPIPTNGRLTPSQIENMVLRAEKESLIKARLELERKRIQEENIRLQNQLHQAMKLQEKLKEKQTVFTSKAGVIKEAPVYPKLPSPYLETPLPDGIQKHSPVNQEKQGQTKHAITAQQSQLSAKEVFEKALQQAASITYDPFYSPILEKIDKVLNNLGFQEEPCRERLICSMYKNPTKYSPHSNLISAELSRDPSELQKPTTTNAAVIRFYKYVQSARDGQDKRDCIRLYALCAINTEK